MTSPAEHYEFLVALLAVILVLELGARRLRLPSAAAFILGGAAVALAPGVPRFSMDPELVLLVFLPPLLMNGGYTTVWSEFRANLGAISLLALGAVVFTTGVVGLTVHALAPGLPWGAAFALGAIVSPPDAVAAAAVLRRLSLPGRLTATLEGESLLNDASGLVLFRLAVAATLTGAFSAPAAAASFAVLSFGGIALGWVAGAAALALLRRLRLEESELSILVTLLAPAAAYMVGERIGVSGVLAVVVAGVMLGRGQHTVLSAATRLRASAFWGVLVFVLESLLFIMIGLALHDVLGRLGRLPDGGRSIVSPMLGVVAAVIGSRFAWVYGTWGVRHLLFALGTPGVARPSLAFATILGWAGMRGVVTLAAALSLPTAMPGRDLLLVSAFAVIVVTVLVQGTTLAPLIRALRLSGAEELAARRASAEDAWAHMVAAQHRAIVEASHRPDGTEAHPRLLEQFGRRVQLTREMPADRETHMAARREHHQAVLHAIEAGRDEVLRLHREDGLHDEVLRSLEHELDLQQLAAEGHLA